MKDSENTNRYLPLNAVGQFYLPLNNIKVLQSILADSGIDQNRVKIKIYPYMHFSGKIQRKNGVVFIAFHPLLAEAPENIFSCAIGCLLNKLERNRCDPQDVRVVNKYLRENSTSHKVGITRKHARKKGNYVDLDEVFRKVNEQYFNDEIEISYIGWSKRSAWKKLACYYPLSCSIIVSPVLDHPEVPDYFLEFVLYHEMLHVLLGSKVKGKSVVYHHREFKKLEHAFPHYRKAREFELKIKKILKSQS